MSNGARGTVVSKFGSAATGAKSPPPTDISGGDKCEIWPPPPHLARIPGRVAPPLLAHHTQRPKRFCAFRLAKRRTPRHRRAAPSLRSGRNDMLMNASEAPTSPPRALSPVGRGSAGIGATRENVALARSAPGISRRSDRTSVVAVWHSSSSFETFGATFINVRTCSRPGS